MIQTDFLIIGQGIAGTLLSFELMNADKKVMVIDNQNYHKSSLVAGAVLNPMAGKHWSPAPQARIFLPKAVETYHAFEMLFGIKMLNESKMLVFHDSPEKQHHFQKQAKAFAQYFEENAEVDLSLFSNENGIGIIKDLYWVDAPVLLQQWQQYLTHQNSFISADFIWDELKISDIGIQYQNIQASHIIFCTGAEAILQPFFHQLPFTQNRGEALILDIPGLPANAIYHRRLRLVPRSDGRFWCGSNYSWKFDNLLPDEKWKEYALTELQSWLKIPFEIKEHIVAKRPTTAGQIPLIGIHQQHNRVAIFNGLGTRGFSAGPHWASEMKNLLLDPSYEMPDYNQQWFAKWFS